MAGRFPGAASVADFWRNLRGGVESIVDLSHDDLLGAGVGEKALANRSYIRRAALLPVVATCWWPKTAHWFGCWRPRKPFSK